ncbi:hypothetical protein HNY73_017271 [Argiope bruennichi]|uniref:DUF19 domain-containing protein n=1 Tax=Argiope bruennichi TaxID=94029 RepID=A0A8T0EL85_ARGBR|nr:hypothetical protein HNY73_017271 [Argiope bruennichi]
MWIFLFYSFTLAQGILAEVDCSKSGFDECETPAMFYFIPTEISTYNRLCPQLTAFFKCLKSFQDKCDEHIFDSKAEYEGMYGAFSDLCEEGTFLNTVATANLRCFNDTFSTTDCPEKMKAITGPYRSSIDETENEDDYRLPIEVMCLQDILESDCLAADIGKNCGQAALEATLEFFRRTFYVEDTCGVENSKHVLKSLDMYKLDEEQKELVIATLEKIIISGGD